MNRTTLLQRNGRKNLGRTRSSVLDGEVEKGEAVQVRVEELVIPTYLPAPPDKNPMFLEKRVYQGSSGKVYPLPFTDRIAEEPIDRKWKAIWIENEFIRALVLPEIGGRIHVFQDKTNGYDAIYRQPVIKPALVGLAGPWISGGIEFNWPQHHRPATFLPVEFEIETHADGSKTIWCSDHDPMARMKGMHGVCLHPGRAYLELKVRAYNRTPFAQTFLWWANVATRVHEAYQSFFPPDVYYVADHARRSMSEFPNCQDHYYGVNYHERAHKGVPSNEIPNQFAPPHSYLRQNVIRNAQRTTLNYAPNDLSWYANIPVPTSYMCMGSKEDFFGGYDHSAKAGIVHYANHHISPGKKQWTWGNHEFGYAWDRNLTDADSRGEFAPYIELMAGVYTDNQPDFSFLQPGETKSWSQYWYPIREIGPAQHANLDAAISLRRAKNTIFLGVAVTRRHADAIVTVARADKTHSTIATFMRNLSPAHPLSEKVILPDGISETDLDITVQDRAGNELIAHRPKKRVQGKVPPPATEPPAPAEIASTDELFLTGLHLEQYRHATRSPTLYWREALRRDPLDSRCNNAMGLFHLRRGEFQQAEGYFHKAIERLTRRNANPYDGEAYYNLGLCLRYRSEFCSSRPEEISLSPSDGERARVRGSVRGQALTSSAKDRNNQSLLTSAAIRILEESYAAFYKATWNRAWARASYHALAEIDCLRRDWAAAQEHLARALRFNTENLRARNLQVIVLRKLGKQNEAAVLLKDILALDPLDWWARHLNDEKLKCDLQTHLDIAHDYARAGLSDEAIELLNSATATANDLPDQSWGGQPLVQYTLGWLEEKRAGRPHSLKHFQRAAALSPDYCFPSRLEEIAVLESAMRANPTDARAPYYLGNLFYDRRRYNEAIRLWERSTQLDPSFSIVWRNLGIGYFNVRKQTGKARAAYDLAIKGNPSDARLLYERDQLWKRIGERPQKRLRELTKRLDLVSQRDDLNIELCALYNQAGQHEKARELIAGRRFQPWEGGEGGPLGQHARAHLALGRKALAASQFEQARAMFESAMASPRNLGEAPHLLANRSDIHYLLGCACAGMSDQTSARRHWLAAANFKGDFQEMSVRAFSEMTYYSAQSLKRLGQNTKGNALFRNLLAFARQLQKKKAQIDYFATSLPAMLLFEDDLQFRQETTALFLQAQAQLGLGQKTIARSLLRTILRRDPNHAMAADFLSDLS